MKKENFDDLLRTINDNTIIKKLNVSLYSDCECGIGIIINDDGEDFSHGFENVYSLDEYKAKILKYLKHYKKEYNIKDINYIKIFLVIKDEITNKWTDDETDDIYLIYK